MTQQSIQSTRVAFKEWSLVCDALAAGTQSLLLRKGGIAEGRDGFAFRQDRFWFFPTRFHTQRDLVTTVVDESGRSRYRERAPEPGEILELDLLGQVIKKGSIKNWEQVKKLGEFHIWKEEVLRDRFDYGATGCLHFALMRVYRAEEPRRLVMNRSLGGCRSWVELPEDGDWRNAMVPVLTDEEFSKVAAAFSNVLEIRE